MTIAVVGAGWAGLSAALALRDAGRDVTVFEAARIVGGRARRIEDSALGAIDNGQHLLLGAYRATLALVRALNPGVDDRTLLLRQPLQVETLDAAFRLQAAPLPAPLHTIVALLRARGMGIGERLGALRMMASLRARSWTAPNGIRTVDALLAHYGQAPALCERLWDPLCVAAMNTPANVASAQVFLNVLRDSMGADRHAGDFVLARTDLSRLWPEAAARQVRVRTGTRVQRVEPVTGAVLVDGQEFGFCVLAVPPYAAHRLLETAVKCPGAEPWRDALASFRYRRIATVTLRLARPWALPLPIMMLVPDPARGYHGQWVIDRHATQLPAPALGELSVVISNADDDMTGSHGDLAARITEQVREQAARRPGMVPMPAVVAHRVIVEKRATFDCTAAQLRPPNKSPWPRLWIAGDWTDTGYPAVLEGAVLSGQAAARGLLASRF